MIIKDYKIANNNESILVSDEGLIHNFGNEIYSLLNQNNNLENNFVKNRAVVYCYADSKIVAERIIKRYNEKNILLPQHKNKSIVDLIKQEQVTLKNKLEIVKFMESLNIPILYVDTSEDLTYNANKVNDFLKSLIQ